ncbi:type II toxin-antitoxin system RelB/DinJ family antitoxin [Pseudoflavonifractor phocaeensis]|uniref:type II toxin-antitoxin system RelB/DinJ family antitoxin n=1 Tax=Pseudoflavonifractor phocaeensis TaxID=1870988 RepID=UPI001959F90A|nr:type II toxin-antitoxin system RelB/DinJ family antitoxin [Pseudoflavonifractor phocaeensis]MBM6885577.1 type II toxin-antitoxin system RelB/DinJ family antitoxin [Pseudoflavonifractor phocaeensis]
MDVDVTFRIDAEAKAQMEDICAQIGMTTSDAFNIFAKAFVRAKGIPFPVNLYAPLEATPSEQILVDVGQTVFASGMDC